VATLGGHLARVVRYWRANGLKPSTIAVYVRWIRGFSEAHRHHADAETAPVHRAAVVAFARSYAHARGIRVRNAQAAACSALHAWSMALPALGVVVPPWAPVRGAPEPVDPVGQAFAAHQRQHRGLTQRSILKQLCHAGAWRAFLHRRRQSLAGAKLRDVDAFVTACAQRHARTTVADICSSLRAFLRFLHATGRRRDDLAVSVVAPLVRRGARPPRALPWADVRRLLGGVDQSTRVGRRDFALLLIMATYGMGAGEVTALTLDDIDWRAGTLRVRRPKTGAPIVVPLLAPVARALVRYLRQGRPCAIPARQVFVRMHAPYTALSSSSAVRHILMTHAQVAGISAPYLGSHVLRHSHATRQINTGAPVQVVADILGHRRPESTSAYARVALDRLREMALPVPSWR
jgi:integrase/recombinase XerD